MLYGSETWCLRDNEMPILRRTKKAIMRAMCGVKMIEKTRSQEFMNLLGLKNTLNQGCGSGYFSNASASTASLPPTKNERLQ